MSERRAKDADESLKELGDILKSGLVTMTGPIPETGADFSKILEELRRLKPDDVIGRLVVSGFVDHPYGPDQQRCQECIYFLVHRKWCDIPEISLHCEPDWWCRLWRI